MAIKRANTVSSDKNKKACKFGYFKYILVFFQGVAFIIGGFDEHVDYCVSFVFVSFGSRSFPLLQVTESGDKLDKEIPVQVLPKLVEDKEVAKWTRPDEGLDLRLLGTCTKVPGIKSSDTIWRKFCGKQPIYPDSKKRRKN